MNPNNNPCEDFYDFVCGGYLEKTHIPDEKTSMSQFARLHEELTYQIKALVESENTEDKSEISKLAKDFYASCMNITRISELGLSPLDKIIKQVGGWPVLLGDKWNASDLDWKKLMYEFDKVDFSTDFFIGVGIIRDFKNNSRHTLA
uniref:Peptidase M13 N-terminal domain-containing protein n=1 Tax=Strigamia maritima TaxID=126957 RepID=T1JI67_STRMM